jgi:aspartate-semialdehyde dehydrogenase
MPSGRAHSSRVAVVGASSLRGKELVQVLEESHFSASDIVLIDTSVPAGTLTEAAGEPTFIRALSEESFEGARFAFFAGTAHDAEQSWSVAQRTGATVIDLTGALAAPGHSANAVPLIPSLGEYFPPPKASAAPDASKPRVYTSPSAPAIIACTLVSAVGLFDLKNRLSVLFLQPVSERELAGVEELEAQTAALLSFREIAKPIFDAQVAFNFLASYGPSAKPRLADTRNAIARDVAAYLDRRIALPAIQLVQAPVFYGYAFAAYAESASTIDFEQLRDLFARRGVKVARAEDEAPDNANVAGENDIHIGRIEADPNVPNGAWIWGAADGLRLAATNAVRIAEELVGTSGD